MNIPPLQLSETLRQQSDTLLSALIHTIKQQGPLTFAEYMQQVLFTPSLGYYSGNLEKIGTKGDFITAPELGPLFARCLAHQCQQILHALNGSTIMEIGAGTGQFAWDCLHALKDLHCLPKSYLIIEPSDDFTKRQKQKLIPFAAENNIQLKWLPSLPTTPIEGVIIANEVLDVLPVHRFEWHPQHILELCVGLSQNDKLCWHKQPAPAALHASIQELPLATLGLQAGYQSEICLQSKPWIAQLNQCLSRGVVLLLDYGFPQCTYYHPERREGTLMCHIQHIAHDDPFLYPGLQDITASVNFTAIAEHASEAKMDILGYTHLAGFLINCGILDVFQATPPAKHGIGARHFMELLLSPTEMGEMFKVLALGKDCPDTLIGFREYCRLASLAAVPEAWHAEQTLEGS